MNTWFWLPNWTIVTGWQGHFAHRLEADAQTFTPEHDLLNLISTAHANKTLHCVLVDEAQFLTRDQVYQLGEVTTADIPVLAYGLRTDFEASL